MRYKALLAVAAAGLVGVSASATAMSVSHVPPHKQPYAICETRKLVEYLNSEWAYQNDEQPRNPAFDTYPSYFIYSDTLGKVGYLSSADHPPIGEPAHQLDWVESLRSAHGKPDQGPIMASRLVLLQADRYSPVYLLTLRRVAWQIYTVYPTMEEVSGYEPEESTWLVQFKGNGIRILRQANELAPAAAQRPNLINRRVDCARLLAEADED